MSSFLGVDFFRIVNEGLVDDWAQVYAKVPFEEEDLVDKGALFGVLRIKGGEELVSKGSEIFLWLDEYFNRTDEKGDLRGLVKGLLKTNDKLQVALAWVVMDKKTGERMVKTTAANGGRVIIVRNEQQVVLSESEEKVIVGGLKTGDKLGLGVGGMVNKLTGLGSSKESLSEMVGSLNEQVEKETGRAVAGLLLEVKKIEKGQDFTPKGSASRKFHLGGARISVRQKETRDEVLQAPPKAGRQSPEQHLAAGRVVGPKGFKKKIVGYWLKTFKKKKRIEVREKRDGNGKVLWLGVVFLVLFLMSVAGGVVKSKRQKVKTSWQSELGSWQKREDEAKSLVQVNPMGARKLLLEVRQEVEKAESVWAETKYEQEWMEYRQKLEKSWIEVSGEKRTEPKLFLGLSLIRSELKGSRMVGLNGGVGVLDLNLGLMVKVELEDKKASVIESDKEKRWRAVGGSGEQTVFLTDKGLSLSDGTGVEFDATVVSPVEVEVFGGGVYVLDAGAGEIWRFNLLGNEIQDRRRWLKPEQDIGIGELVDLDIDGDIWVLGKKGEMAKLRRGNRERFALEGKPDNLVGDRLAVQLEGDKIAVLDVKNSRVVVFNKESGEYLHQLIWDGFSEAKDILYIEDGRLMVLSGGKLYWIE